MSRCTRPHYHAIYQRNPRCVRSREGERVMCRPSGALRIHPYSTAVYPPCGPSAPCTTVTLPPTPSGTRVISRAPRPIGRRQSGRLVARQRGAACLPALMREGASIQPSSQPTRQPASGDLEPRRNRANSEKLGSFRGMIPREKDAASTTTFLSFARYPIACALERNILL